MKDSYYFYIVGVIFGLFYLVITNPYQLAVTPDSVSYIEVALNFAKGKGIVNGHGVLVNHWPPFYAMVLGGITMLTSKHIIQVGVYLNLIFIIIYAFCFFKILCKLKIHSKLIVPFLILLLFSIPSTEFLALLSDGLFVTLYMVVLLVFFKWLYQPSKRLIIIAGTISGLMLLTRYSALGFIAGFSLVLLTRFDLPVKQRLITLIYYLSPVVSLFLLWILYTSTFSSPPLDRHISWHPIPIYKLKFAIKVLYDWFIAKPVFGALLLGLLVLLGVKMKSSEKILVYRSIKRNSHFFSVLVIPTLSYIGFTIVSISLFDSHTPLDYRMLMPIYPVVLICIAFVTHHVVTSSKLRRLAYLLVIGLIISTMISSIQPWQNHYKKGVGFTGEKWKHSEAISFIQHNEYMDVYTNGVDAVRFFSNANCQFIPRHYQPNVQKSNSEFKDEVEHMKMQVKNQKKQVLYLDKIDWRNYLMTKRDILATFQGFEVIYFEDGFLIK